MPFIFENVHLLLLSAVALIVLIREIVKTRKATERRGLTELTTLIATFALAWATDRMMTNSRAHNNVPYFIKQMAESADNEYARSVLADFEDTLDKFKNRTAEAYTELDVRHQLSRALKKTDRTVWFMDQYVLSWTKDAEYAFQEDKLALARQVDVQRTFVLNDGVLLDKELLAKALAVMDRQRLEGVKVSYIFQHEIEGDPEYRRFGYVDYALFDGHILAKIGGRVAQDAPPLNCTLWWDQSAIKSETPFSWLPSTGRVKPFDQRVARMDITRFAADLAGTHK